MPAADGGTSPGRRVAGRIGGGLSSYHFVTYAGLDRTVVQTVGEDRSPPFRAAPDGDRDAAVEADCGDLQRHEPARVTELGLRPATVGELHP